MSKDNLVRVRSWKVIDREHYFIANTDTVFVEEEKVMSEVLRDWKLYGLSPIFGCENNLGFQQAIKNLRKNNATLKTLLKDDIYGLATKRLVSSWPEKSFEKKYLEYLILRCDAQVRVPVNNRVH